MRWVRKRDGAIVPFDRTKIAEAIFKAVQAVGDDDRFLADELAGVVCLFLRRHYSGEPPGIEEIQDMVEKVLIETGHAKIAKAYILYRDRRAQVRRKLQVHKSVDRPDMRVQTGSGDQAEPWDKARIARALEVEAQLDRDVARKVATAVEQRVLSSGFRKLTTHLIRELVDAELLERGLRTTLQRQALLGIPKYDLQQTLVADARSPADIDRAVAAHTLRQYALQEIFSDDVAEAHLSGQIHLKGLTDPARVPEVAVDARALVPGCRDGHEFAGRLAVTLLDACRWCSERLIVAFLDTALERLAGAAASVDAAVRGLKQTLAYLEGRTERVLLHLADTSSEPAVRSIRRRLAVATGQTDQPETRVALALPPVDTLSEVTALLSPPARVSGAVLLQHSDSMPVSEAIVVRDGVVVPHRICEQAIGLNLARPLGTQAETPDVAAYLRGLERSLDLVLKAVLEHQQFLKQLMGSHDPWRAGMEGAVAALELIGLEAVVGRLAGARLEDSEVASAIAEQILVHVRRHLDRNGRKLGARVVLGRAGATGAGLRLWRLDHRHQTPDTSAPGSAYSEGVVTCCGTDDRPATRLLLNSRLCAQAGGGTLLVCLRQAGSWERLGDVLRLATSEIPAARMELEVLTGTD